MPLLNFKKCFVQSVLSGSKQQTIRKKRKRPFYVDDTLFLYTGLRTKSCQLLGTRKVIEVDEIWMNNYYTHLNGFTLSYTGLKKIALGDGFDSIEAFRDFFKKTHGFPFYGQLIKWRW